MDISVAAGGASEMLMKANNTFGFKIHIVQYNK